MVPTAYPSHHPNGISIRSAVFVWVPNAMLYNALTVEKKTSKTAPERQTDRQTYTDVLIAIVPAGEVKLT